MTSLKLTGLDAQNPLAYFAALGLLRVLDLRCTTHGAPRPKLAFVDEGQQVPVVSTQLDAEAIVGIVLEDAAAQRDNTALRLAYDDDGNIVEPDALGAIRDLKPTPASAREFLERCARAGRRAADLAAGFFCELVTDKTKGNTKPTALHFTAGQQAFLTMVETLRANITSDDVREALFGAWRYESTLPSLSWDSSVSRLYALRASDPSKEKRGSIPAAYWLGVQALTFFPVCVERGVLSTPGVKGGWKDSSFCWPLWMAPASAPTIAALLKIDPTAFSSRERAAMGLTQVFAARISRSDQGGYGAFSPADVVVPRVESRRR
jgi:hypothetical protein